jgi:hypothetical protein
MDFFIFLTPIGNQILNDLVSSKIRVYENIGMCRTEKIFGYLKNSDKLIICTDNIQNSGYDPYTYVNETLYHESVHVAQSCRSKKTFGFSRTLGIPKEKMPLSEHKKTEIRKSVAISNNPGNIHREHEAYYFEDKPHTISKYIRKYCF